MLRIHGHAGSINVRKVLWACEEMAIPFERLDWGGAFRPVSDPAFLALNPVGLIPVIEDGGHVIRESNTILRYLAATRGRGDLLPLDPVARARVEMWMDWQSSDLNNSWRYAFMALVRQSADHSDRVEIARSARMVNALMAKLAGVLADGGFVAGPAFTLADVPIGLSIHRWRSMPIERSDLPALEAYYAALSARPGFVRHGVNGGP